MSKNIIIVGGGIAGITAGIHAIRSGFHAVILEMHALPGGNATSWRRNGYLFEGGMHWLTGSREGHFLNGLWKEVGALQENNPVNNRDPFLVWMHGSERVCLYRNLTKLEQHFNEISPEDFQATHILCRDLKKFGSIQMPTVDIKGKKTPHKNTAFMKAALKSTPALFRMGEYTKQSWRQKTHGRCGCHYTRYLTSH